MLDQQGASYARILSYARALTQTKDLTVYLLSTLYPEQFKEVQKEISPQIFICGKAAKADQNTSFAQRTTGKVFGKEEFNAFLSNVSSFIDEFMGNKSVLVYPSINNHANELELIKLVKSKNIRIISERNELNVGKMFNYPFPKNPVKKALFGLYYPFKYLDHYKRDKLVAKYDGNIAISTTMEKKIARVNNSLLRIPILANVQQFSDAKEAHKKSSDINIGFTGYLTIKKDGIGELIEAISILQKKYAIDNVILNLYGTGYRDTLAKIKSLIKKYRLENKVILHGKVPSGDIPEILKRQDILILTRPVNLQTRYGFSTKLAEYMASGITVLTTDVSDNTLFIKDGENGFIAKSYKAEETAEKLAEIIKGKKYLDTTLRKKAQETAHNHFDGNKYATELLNFFFPN